MDIEIRSWRHFVTLCQLGAFGNAADAPGLKACEFLRDLVNEIDCQTPMGGFRPEESYKGDQQVNGENEEVAHGAGRTMTARVRKSARHGRIPSCYEFASHSQESGAGMGSPSAQAGFPTDDGDAASPATDTAADSPANGAADTKPSECSATAPTGSSAIRQRTGQSCRARPARTHAGFVGSPEPCVQHMAALRRMHWTHRVINQIIRDAQAMTGATGCVARSRGQQRA